MLRRVWASGIPFVVLAVMGYSFLGFWTNRLLDRGLEPFDIAAWRYLFAAPIFWAIVWVGRRRAPVDTRPLPRLRLMGLGVLLGIAALTAFFGLAIMPAGTYSVIFYTYPAMIALIGLFIGERLPWQGWAALGLTLIGLLLTVPDFSEGLSGDALPGVILALVNALVVAIYFILNGRTLRGRPSVTLGTAWIVTGAAILLITTGILSGLTIPQGDTWLYIVGMAVWSTVLPVFSISNAIKRLGAARTSIIGSFEPLITAAVSFVLLSQEMQAIQWLGGVVMVISVILLQTSRAPAPENRNTAIPETVTEAAV